MLLLEIRFKFQFYPKPKKIQNQRFFNNLTNLINGKYLNNELIHPEKLENVGYYRQLSNNKTLAVLKLNYRTTHCKEEIKLNHYNNYKKLKTEMVTHTKTVFKSDVGSRKI